MEATKKEILAELKEKFEVTQKELGFKVSYDELDSAFYITDFVLGNGFVSENFSRQVCARLVEIFNNWHGYLNGLIMPNSGYVAGQTECKLFSSQEDKNMIWDLIKVAMEISSRHSVIGLNKDRKMEAQFIDDCYNLWINDFKPGLMKIMFRINEGWKNK